MSCFLKSYTNKLIEKDESNHYFNITEQDILVLSRFSWSIYSSFVHMLNSLQLFWLYSFAHDYVCCQYILLEAIPCQLFLHIWIQARIWVGVSRSSPPQFWSCSASINLCALKPWHGGRFNNKRLWNIHRTSASDLGFSKLIKLN